MNSIIQKYKLKELLYISKMGISYFNIKRGRDKQPWAYGIAL